MKYYEILRFVTFSDFSCLTDAAHWLSGCAQLLGQSARLAVAIIIQIRMLKDGEVDKGDMMRRVIL